MKTCSKCKAIKQIKEFSKSKVGKDGVRSQCKACMAAYNVAYRAANRETTAAYYAANRDNKSASQSAWCYANRDAISARYAANPGKVAAQQAEYRAANPDKMAAKARNRRARKRNAHGSHTAADIRRIFDAQRGLCANCHARLLKSGKQKFHVDHIVPLVRGGSNWPDNLQLLCKPCNLRKGAKLPEVWAKENERLF